MKKKRFTLLSIAILTALAGNAQQLAPKGEMANKNDMENMPRQTMERAAEGRKARSRRTFQDGLYYTIPGALYGGWSLEGSGYYASLLMVPPFVDVTYANQMTDKTQSTWSINGSDRTEYANENGNFVSAFTPDGWFNTPALGQKKSPNTYQFNEDNYFVQTGQRETNDNSYVASYSPDLLMTPADNHGTRYSNGTAYRNVLSGYGFLSTKFLFGTGDLVDENTTAYGFEQTYNPLLAPMYVDAICLDAVTYNKYGPIPRGKTIKAYILALDEEGRSTDVIATFEATATDTLDFVESDTYNGQVGFFGTVVYRNSEKFTDIFGNSISLPAAIPPGVPFRIQFEGMNEEGVSLGAYGIFKSEVEDSYIENGYLLFDNGTAYTFQNPICVNIGLLGQYEVIKVQDKDFLLAETEEGFPADKFKGWNVLRVSADGKTISTEGLQDNESFNMGCAFVGTSTPWYDEDGLPNYDVDESLLPDWVEGLQVDTTLYNGDNLTGYNLVYPVCKPLPAGVEGRRCEIDILGQAGITGDKKIIIIQGNDANPQPTDGYKLYSDDVEFRTGTTASFSLSLNNPAPVIMTEFYLQLPEGITIATDADGYLDATLNSSRSNRHSLEVERNTNGMYHFLIFHSRNNALNGNAGELININVNIDGNMAPGSYKGFIKNILLNDEAKNEIILPDAEFGITVTNVIMGDVNDDKKINGSDIVELVDRIMGRPSSKFVEAAADLNGDGKINGSDLTAEISLVMSQSVTPAPRWSGEIKEGLTTLIISDEATSVAVDAAGGLILAQMVVELPAGHTLEGITTDKHHSVACKRLQGNKYSVLCYSTSNAPFEANSSIITLHHSAGAEVSVSNAMMVDSNRKELFFGNAIPGDATGISGASAGRQQTFDIYSADGVLVRSQASTTDGLQKGFYVINGKKYIAK